MMAEPDRYSRQRRLVEVGARGQEALAAASIRIGTRNGAMVELSYLLRAGVRDVSMSASVGAAPFPHQRAFRHGVAGAHAAGAWRALMQIEQVLETVR